MALTSDGKDEISLTNHVLERARIRFRLPADEREVRRFILADVAQALQAGRIGKRLPRNFSFDGRTGTWNVATRFLWTEDETRGYIVVSRTSNGQRRWVVKTAVAAVR